jgi:hypothetical protein
MTAASIIGRRVTTTATIKIRLATRNCAVSSGAQAILDSVTGGAKVVLLAIDSENGKAFVIVPVSRNDLASTRLTAPATAAR